MTEQSASSLHPQLQHRIPDRTCRRAREGPLLIALFGVALLAHLILVTGNWTCTFMPGHEFRQAQTAIVTQYIDKQNNFSLLYETPILGKPWISILLEVPIYQWSVVLLGRATGWEHLIAARTVSLACFYLALPALYLLLGRLSLAGPRRLLVLTLVLTCPVYLFYSRAFLMESMVVMCCAWFLLGFVRTMDERSWAWLLLTIVTGTCAALIKSITFAVWLLPAAAYGFHLLWREVRAGQGWRRPLATMLWGGATVVFALGALRAWIAYTDPIKEAHASAFIFSSKNLSLGNWGLFDLKSAFAPRTWAILFERWREALMSPWVVIALLGIGFAFQTTRWRMLGLATVFFGAQLLFPFAYAYQDYYYYACAAFLAGAVGFVLFGALDSRLPRWLIALVIALPISAQGLTYWKTYRSWQMAGGHGGYPYTQALAALTPKESVLVVAGNDWAAMAPLYAQRRALMIRNGLEFDGTYLRRAFSELQDEEVSALVIGGTVRTNREFIGFATAALNLEAEPTFSDERVDVYVSRFYADNILAQLRGGSYAHFRLSSRQPGTRAEGEFNIPSATARSLFRNVSPAPNRGRFFYGVDLANCDGDVVLSAHPDCDLWVPAPAGATVVEWDFGLMPDAYEKEGARTDGVEFFVEGETTMGGRRLVYRRILDPVNRPGDRGRQREKFDYQPRPDEVLRFSTRGNGGLAFDWAYWARISIR